MWKKEGVGDKLHPILGGKAVPPQVSHRGCGEYGHFALFFFPANENPVSLPIPRDICWGKPWWVKVWGRKMKFFFSTPRGVEKIEGFF